MRSLRPMLSAVTPLLMTLTACTSAEDPPLEEADVTAALEQENGGFDTTDEAPMFGDGELFVRAAIETDTAANDDLAADPIIRELDARPGVIHHRVAIVWGQMPPNRAAATAKVWTGTLELSGGAMLVRRTIGFEERDDLLERRTDRTTVAFQSVTKPFVDGLVLSVYDDTATDGLTLSYHGAAGDYQIDLAALADGPIVLDVDGDGNKLAAIALTRDAGADATDPCSRGFMRGRWHQLRPTIGVYAGVVVDVEGAPVGHVRGIYGERRNGEHVFFGKFINRDGAFTGLMGGHYRGGEFAGRWITRSGDAGRLHGVYRDGPGREIGGAWAARWAETRCAERLPTDMP